MRVADAACQIEVTWRLLSQKRSGSNPVHSTTTTNEMSDDIPCSFNAATAFLTPLFYELHQSLCPRLHEQEIKHAAKSKPRPRPSQTRCERMSWAIMPRSSASCSRCGSPTEEASTQRTMRIVWKTPKARPIHIAFSGGGWRVVCNKNRGGEVGKGQDWFVIL